MNPETAGCWLLSTTSIRRRSTNNEKERKESMSRQFSLAYLTIPGIDLIHQIQIAREAGYAVRLKEDLIVNLGSETGLSVREIVETARRVTGQPIPSVDSPRRPGDPAKLVASSALAHEKLGWTAKRSDAETLIASTWKVYQANMKK